MMHPDTKEILAAVEFEHQPTEPAPGRGTGQLPLSIRPPR